jgi:hypothetical protein
MLPLVAGNLDYRSVMHASAEIFISSLSLDQFTLNLHQIITKAKVLSAGECDAFNHYWSLTAYLWFSWLCVMLF